MWFLWIEQKKITMPESNGNSNPWKAKVANYFIVILVVPIHMHLNN
jgi:hypothetical protein